MWMELLFAIVAFISLGLAFMAVLAIFVWLMNRIDPGLGFRR